MNVGFFIDKSQTVQSILGLIREVKKRVHHCDVFSTCSPKSLRNNPKIGIDLNDVGWLTFENRDRVGREVIKNHDKYHALIGINLFNNIWRSTYNIQNTNTYAVEYCWNEIYNNRSLDSGPTLFSKSEWSRDAIKSLTNYEKINFLGSPWFEVINDFRQLPSSEEKIITFMAPHNSFIQNCKGFLDNVTMFLLRLRNFCNKNGYKLILKTRSKYRQKYHEFVNFDAIVSDDDIVSHLRLYASSACVFNFSSSAINELTFLQTPYVCLFSEFHRDLHKNGKDCHFKGMSLINDQYYSGKIFDGKHCDVIYTPNTSDKNKFLYKIDSELDKVYQMINAKDKDWDLFQKTYFPGDHSDASLRIIDFIERECRSQK